MSNQLAAREAEAQAKLVADQNKKAAEGAKAAIDVKKKTKAAAEEAQAKVHADQNEKEAEAAEAG